MMIHLDHWKAGKCSKIFFENFVFINFHEISTYECFFYYKSIDFTEILFFNQHIFENSVDKKILKKKIP